MSNIYKDKIYLQDDETYDLNTVAMLVADYKKKCTKKIIIVGGSALIVGILLGSLIKKK